MSNPMTHHSSLLDGSTPEEFAHLGLTGARALFPKNTLLIQEGDQSRQLYVVLQGNLREFAMSQDGEPP
jgi:CRP-like cAMP-binding protein